MFNVQIKHYITFAVVAITLSSCSSGGFFGPSPAEELSAKIDTLINTGQYQEALQYIDTLNTRYPKEVELRKASMLSRARAMEGVINDSIPIVDAQIERTQQELDSLKPYFTAVNDPGLPGYIVDKAVRNVNLLSGNNLQPRLGDALSSWTLVVNVKGHKNITGLSIEIDGRRASSSASNAESRRVKGSSGEMFSFTTAEVDPIAEAIAGSVVSPAVLYIETSTGAVSIKLSEPMVTAIWRTYIFSKLREEHRLALVRRELLERKLAVARNQVENLSGK